MNPLHEFKAQATRRTFRAAIAALLVVTVASPARADRQEDFKKLEAERADADNKFSEERSEVKPPPDTYFIRRVDNWPRWQFMPRYTALADADPTDKTAYQCCQWISQRSAFAGDRVQFAAEQKAWPILAAHHASGDQLPQLCLKASEAATPAREQFLRDLLKKTNLSKEHTGYATFALAELLVNRMDSAEFLQKNRKPSVDRPLVKHLQSRFDPVYAQYLSDTNPDACKAESTRLLHTVIDVYGDVPDTSSRRHKTSLGEKAKQSLYALEHLSVGAVAPPIVGQDLDGHPLKLQDFRGRVVMLSFWFTGCGPCMEMIPEERKLTEKFKARPFTLIGVCGDEDREQAKKTAAEEKITWTCWFDNGTAGSIARDYNITGWPTFYLIDQTGHIAEKDLARDQMEATITNLLGKSVSEK